MIVYKCKMCNGNLDMSEHKRLVKCNYCDTFQSVPSVIDEDKAEMVNRANRYRQNGEFDRASSIYQQILKEDAGDPEIHWSIVLCKFGVEYVEDPATKHMVPTINRTQSHSVLQDSDYQDAIAIAQADAKQYYMTEADRIDQIQRSIWRIAHDAESYDVFISYKEKGPDGQRTQSSLIAQRMYEALTAAGIKTFYSRISLASKLGNEFEPYIFSALNSAYVMLVLGTNKDEFTAPWVKNEWSRYRKLAATDSHKRLIPCVQNATVEDLPDELQPYQAQDMNKAGSEQDILDAVKRIVSQLKATERVLNETDAEKLLKNGETYITLKDFKTAELIFRDLCDKEPENYRVWWGRIRSATKDLDDTNSMKNHSEDFKIWMDFIRKLASSKDYKNLAKKYATYLKKVSKQSVFEEIENVKKIKEQTIERAENLKIELQNLPTEKFSSEKELEELCEELESTLESAKKSRQNIKTKKLLIISGAIFFLIAFGVLFVIEVLTPWSLYIFVPIIAVIGSILGPYDDENHIDEIENYDAYIQNLQNQITDAKNNLNALRAAVDPREVSLRTSIQKCDDIVENADRYLSYDTDAISNLLFAIMCSEIFEDAPMDHNLFEVRQQVFQPVE